MRPPVLCLLGPTAVGKTAVAVELCERLDGEVITADSRQIYRGLAIGTAQPTDDQRHRAPHHLVGFLDPREPYSVAQFCEAAKELIAGILRRGRTPIVVAGTGLYLRALAEGWTLSGVAAAPELREQLEAEADAQGETALHHRLAEVDPDAAARIAPADRKRIIRALEVHAVSGRPLSELHATDGRRPVSYQYQLYGLHRPRPELYARIDARVEQMMVAGWLGEVQNLVAEGLTGDEPGLEGLGYRWMMAHLRGELPLSEAVALTQRDSRRYAKRQLTWFRHMPDVHWLELAADEPATLVAERVTELWRTVTVERT